MSLTWGAEAGAVLAPGARGLMRILGGPGTGKSSLLVDAGVAPESVLLLTGAGRIGMRERSALTMALLRARGTGPCRSAIREPLVRRGDSYAHPGFRGAGRRGRGGAPPP